MANKNKYVIRSRISEDKFRKVVKYFCLDIEASKIAQLAKINRNTVNRYLNLIRKRIFEHCILDKCKDGNRSNIRDGEGIDDFASDQEYGDCGIHFGIIQVQDKVFTEAISDRWRDKLGKMSSICRGMSCISKLDHFRKYCGIIDVKTQKLYCIRDEAGVTRRKKQRCPRPEIFWAFAKSRLSKFNGISRSTFYLHLKECEFRFNNRNEDIYKLLLEIIRKNPLK